MEKNPLWREKKSVLSFELINGSSSTDPSSEDENVRYCFSARDLSARRFCCILDVMKTGQVLVVFGFCWRHTNEMRIVGMAHRRHEIPSPQLSPTSSDFALGTYSARAIFSTFGGIVVIEINKKLAKS